MSKNSVIEQLARNVSVACSSVGIAAGDIAKTGTGIAIKSLLISVDLKLVGTGRMWVATESVAMMMGDNGTHKLMRRAVMEVPLGQEWSLARRLALHLAARQVDIAIEKAILQQVK